MHQDLRSIFNKAQLRITAPRIAVFEVLQESTTPLSIMQIVRASPALDKVGVYRTIKLFSELHIVTNIHTGWKQSYELAGPFRPHHHHLICDGCGGMTELHSKKVERVISEIAESYGFRPLQHHFEVRGLCLNCQ